MADLGDIKQKLAGLKELLDSQLISQEDFEREKKTLLELFVGKDKAPPNNNNSNYNNINNTNKNITSDDKNINIAPNKNTTKDNIVANKTDFSITSLVDPNDASLVWCGMNIAFPIFSTGMNTRKRIIVLLLDRSGSMQSDWPLVVESVRLVAPSLLQDPQTILKIIVYSNSATEVSFPDNTRPTEERVTALCNSLSNVYKPSNEITIFMQAFRRATSSINDYLQSADFSSLGMSPSQVSVSILLFTDGKDTSIWTGGSMDLVASAASARTHFDNMKRDLQSTKCGVFYYIAAYTSEHDPQQCQYFSDKYKYIDRPETLSSHLSSLVGEMASGMGFCNLIINLPESSGYKLAEDLPAQLPLDESGKLDYHIWIKAIDSNDSDVSKNSLESEKWLKALCKTKFVVEAHSIGMESQFFEGYLEVQPVSSHSLPVHTYKLDRAAFWLRNLSREIVENTGKISSQAQAELMKVLRSTLNLVRRETHESRTLSLKIPSTGPNLNDTDRLAFMRSGSLARAALRCPACASNPSKKSSRCAQCVAAIASVQRTLVARLDTVDALSNRLSHVVDEYEKNTINGVRVRAILADSQQHLPIRVQRMLTGQVTISNAARIRDKDELLASLPPHSTKLTTYGEQFTTDMFGQLNAEDVSSSSDAHFFYLNAITTKTNNDNLQLKVKSVKDGIGFISLSAFTFLKESGMKQRQGTDYVVKGVGEDDVSNVWLPCYFTSDHFRRGLLHFPDALGRLAFNDPLSFSWLHYQLPFEVFGRSIVSSEMKKEIEWTLLLHKTRSLFEFSKVTVNENDGKSFLQHATDDILSFIRNPSRRGKESIRSLYRLVSYAFLLDQSEFDVEKFLQQVYLEMISRSVRWFLKKNSSLTASSFLLGLLGQTLTSDNNNNNNNNNNNITVKADANTPWKGVFTEKAMNFEKLREIVNNKSHNPTTNATISLLYNIIDESKKIGKLSSIFSPSEWNTFADVLLKWRVAQQRYGGLQGLFNVLDSSLTEEGGDKKIEEVINSMRSFVSPFNPPPSFYISDCALSTSIPFLSSSSSSSSSSTPSHIACVQKGAVLTIQRYYRRYKQRKGDKKFLSMGINGGLPLSFTARWWTPEIEIAERDEDTVTSHCVPAILAHHIQLAKAEKAREEREIQERIKRDMKNAKIIERRWAAVQQHPVAMPSSNQMTTRTMGMPWCWSCEEVYDRNHSRKVWGYGAEPEDSILYEQARRNVLNERHYDSVVEIDSHTEKEYKKLGGKYRFPDPQNDTYITGLHARVIALRVEWSRNQQLQSKTTEDAVAEILARVRWDDRIEGAKEKLERIAKFLWEAAQGGPSVSDIPSSIAPHNNRNK